MINRASIVRRLPGEVQPGRRWLERLELQPLHRGRRHRQGPDLWSQPQGRWSQKYAKKMGKKCENDVKMMMNSVNFKMNMWKMKDVWKLSDFTMNWRIWIECCAGHWNVVYCCRRASLDPKPADPPKMAKTEPWSVGITPFLLLLTALPACSLRWGNQLPGRSWLPPQSCKP